MPTKCYALFLVAGGARCDTLPYYLEGAVLGLPWAIGPLELLLMFRAPESL